LFAVVVNLVRLGFAGDWISPLGYISVLLKPLALTIPGYLVLRAVLTRRPIASEVKTVLQSLQNGALSIACYAPVIWFYLVTSPTPTRTFPVIALSFGALAFWAAVLVNLARGSRGTEGRAVVIGWLLLTTAAEAQTLLGWLATGIEGRM